jgi:predicted SAM-dependent methyltransferase
MTPYIKPPLHKRIFRRIVLLEYVFPVVEWIAFLIQKKDIARRQADDSLKLHLGCGPHLLPGWINGDMELYPGVLPQKLPRGLKYFASDSVRCIYCSHFVEHLDYPGDALAFLQECRRILRPGGALRIIVPGIEPILRAYVADNQVFFKLQAEMHPADCTTKLEHLMYALQQEGQHKYGYDYETMAKLLGRAGFKKVYPGEYNTSPVEDLRIEYRVARDETGAQIDLCVEAIKT